MEIAYHRAQPNRSVIPHGFFLERFASPPATPLPLLLTVLLTTLFRRPKLSPSPSTALRTAGLRVLLAAVPVPSITGPANHKGLTAPGTHRLPGLASSVPIIAATVDNGCDRAVCLVLDGSHASAASVHEGSDASTCRALTFSHAPTKPRDTRLIALASWRPAVPIRLSMQLKGRPAPCARGLWRRLDYDPPVRGIVLHPTVQGMPLVLGKTKAIHHGSHGNRQVDLENLAVRAQGGTGSANDPSALRGYLAHVG